MKIKKITKKHRTVGTAAQVATAIRTAGLMMASSINHTSHKQRDPIDKVSMPTFAGSRRLFGAAEVAAELHTAQKGAGSRKASHIADMSALLLSNLEVLHTAITQLEEHLGDVLLSASPKPPEEKIAGPGSTVAQLFGQAAMLTAGASARLGELMERLDL
jgi:hypothetical protein